MKFSIPAAVFLTSVLQVLAMPANNTLSARFQYRTCGTTGDAVASDCETLLNSNFTLNYDKGHTCSYYDHAIYRGVKAYNPVCLGTPGNCCIYTTVNHFTVDEVRIYGKELLKCRSAKKNRVNGRIMVPKGFLCLSDGKGCGDCFED